MLLKFQMGTVGNWASTYCGVDTLFSRTCVHFVQVLELCEKLNLREIEVADMVELFQAAFCVVIVVSCSNQEYSDNYEHKEKNKSLEKHIVCQEKKSMRSCGQGK